MCDDYDSLPKQKRTETVAENALAKLGFDPQAVEAALQPGSGLTTADKAACRFAATWAELDTGSSSARPCRIARMTISRSLIPEA